jgi:hypothetical protein
MKSSELLKQAHVIASNRPKRWINKGRKTTDCHTDWYSNWFKNPVLLMLTRSHRILKNLGWQNKTHLTIDQVANFLLRSSGYAISEFTLKLTVTLNKQWIQLYLQEGTTVEDLCEQELHIWWTRQFHPNWCHSTSVHAKHVKIAMRSISMVWNSV